MANEMEFNPESGTVTVINQSSVKDEFVMAALGDQHPEFAALARWASASHARTGGLFERDIYVTPTAVFEQMITAQHAAENDDIVSGVLDSTESLAFSKLSFECDDEDQEDIWNQIAADIDLDSRLREMWRELFIVSQFYAVTWWGRKTYRVSGKDPKSGVKRKKVFPNLKVPLGLTLMDPLKIVPVGSMMFNQEQLAYITTRAESEIISNILENRTDDTIISTIIQGEFLPDRQERNLIANMGVAMDRLWLLDPTYVWKHTATRPQYRRFADIRLKSIFELLDLKHQLREMDRAYLLGATNFIVLVKKGSDQIPGKPEEIMNLQSQVRTLSRVPVIVGDHRLSIEIITPKTDHTLDPARYGMINNQIAGRLYQTFVTNSSALKDDSLKLARVVARGMESRRHMLRRSVEKYVIKPIMDANDMLTEMPSLQFHPHQIALDFDAALANYLLDLRDRGDISRETILNQVDIDQDDEFRLRKRERDNGYDDIFETMVPYTAQVNMKDEPQGTPGNKTVAPADKSTGGGASVKSPRTAGRTQGGTRNRGGAAPGTGQGQPARNPGKKSK